MNDSDRVLAPGVPLTLTDGRVVTLRYGMRALKEVEDEFGSVGAIQKLMAYDEEGNATGKAIGAIWFLLRAGLRKTGLTEDDLDDLLDPAEIQTYSEVVEKAFRQAFPKVPEAVGGVSLNGSPGTISTISPPSVSDEVKVSSGT